MKNIQNIEVKKLDKSQIEITGEIPVEFLEKYRPQVSKKLSAHIELPGFRKGKVPEKLALKEIGETVILEEMAELALKEVYPQIIKEEKIEAIGQPMVTITKLAPNNPLGFKITATILPEITLADYSKIAKEELVDDDEKIEVQDKEVEDLISNIQRQYQANLNIKEKTPSEDKKEISDDNSDDNKEVKNKTSETPPEITDEFVKKLGDFKNVDDFKKKLRENIKLDKENKIKEKKRITMVEKIISDSKIELPQLIIEAELEKMMNQFHGDIAKMGLKFDEYLKHIKKTEEDLKKEWQTDAEKRGKWQLILNKIAEDEKIKPNKEEVEKEVKAILEQYKEADPQNAEIYASSVLINKKVFEFLEKQK